jgi:hypothetical protein
MTAWGVALLLFFAAENTLEVKVSVPPAGIATPILMLQGLEIGANEGFSIRVLGPAVAGGERPVFGVAAIEGERQGAPKEPRQKMDLAIPLNVRAREALSAGREVSLGLEIRGNPEHKPLKVDRVYFVVTP